MMIHLLASGLVLIGAYILVIALVEVRHLMAELPMGKIRQRWLVLRTMIAVFILGYIIYTFDFWGQHTAWNDLIVPLVFFLGAGFVWLSVVISFQTAIDIRRMTILEQENITDPLTGIYNRRYLNRRIEEECARAKRYHAPLSVLLIDIDHFKRINDSYGHQVGDVVLCQIARIILQEIRETDILARYGGDELLVISPATALPLSTTQAERLRQAIECAEIKVENISAPLSLRVTSSIGVAHINAETEDSHSLLRRADKALYRAKREGRNRICVYDAESPKTNPEMWE